MTDIIWPQVHYWHFRGHIIFLVIQLIGNTVKVSMTV